MNIDQGRADTRLTTQMRRTIFLASPTEDLARGDRGLQIARYLEVQKKCKKTKKNTKPPTKKTEFQYVLKDK